MFKTKTICCCKSNFNSCLSFIQFKLGNSTYFTIIHVTYLHTHTCIEMERRCTYQGIFYFFLHIKLYYERKLKICRVFQMVSGHSSRADSIAHMHICYEMKRTSCDVNLEYYTINTKFFIKWLIETLTREFGKNWM